jgi:AraC-like DNA-binding protein
MLKQRKEGLNMPVVAVMLAEPAAQSLAAEQIGTLAVVHFCETVEALEKLVVGGGVDAVVADLRDISGSSILPTFATLRRQAPHVPLILHCLPTPAAVRELPDITVVGRGLSLVFRNCEHLGLALRPLLTPPRVLSAAETLAQHVVPLVPVPFRPFVLVCAFKASPRLRVGTAATWSAVSRRTLERSLKHARLPGAATVLGSCTALHAAWWLDVQGWSAKQVVTEMRFSHASALIRILKRYFGCSLKSLRDEGGFQGLLYRFEATLVGGSSLPARFQPL